MPNYPFATTTHRFPVIVRLAYKSQNIDFQAKSIFLDLLVQGIPRILALCDPTVAVLYP